MQMFIIIVKQENMPMHDFRNVLVMMSIMVEV